MNQQQGRITSPAFEAWLGQVTQTFPAATARQLEVEFRHHYEEAVGALPAATDREEQVLKLMGDADHVRQALEETHYTEAELQWLQQDKAVRRLLGRPFSWWGWLGNLLLMLVVPWVIRVSSMGSPAVWTALVLYAAVLLPFFALEAFIRLKWRGVSGIILFRVMMLVGTPIIVFATCLIVFDAAQSAMSSPPWWIMAPFVGMLIGILRTYPKPSLHLFRKALRNAR